ncbi:putative sieve element occlusion [Helianthus annuus]|nr:putative sieve element occlusion [Helianthus annuus]
MATVASIPLEMAYVGKSKKTETVRRAIATINVEKLSYCWLDITRIWYFWTRLESMLLSKIQLNRTDDQDFTMEQIMKLLSYEKDGSWAMLCRGSHILTHGHGSSMMQTLADIDLWKEHIPSRAFDLSFKDYHDKLLITTQSCSDLSFPLQEVDSLNVCGAQCAID